MPTSATSTRRSIGWMGLKRGHKARPLEWLAEKFIFLVSLSAIIVIFLIFLFVAREALPIFLGRMNSSLAGEVIPVEKMNTMSDQELMIYLELTPQQFKQLDKEGLQALMEVKVETKKEMSTDKDAAVNTTRWRYLLLPYQWTGYDKPEYIWQPISQIHKYNI